MNHQTKNLISQKYVALVKQKGKVSVTDLVKECHISRQTFYYHFKDLDEVVEWIIQLIIQEYEKKSSRANTVRDTIYLFFKTCYDLQPELELALNSSRRNLIQDSLFSSLTVTLRRILNGNIIADSILSKMDEETKELLFLFYTYGIIGFIFNNRIQTEEDVNHLTEKVHQMLISSFIKG